jgi:hypothetical protein
MPLLLPTLQFDGRTRVGGEFYLYYNLEDAYEVGRIGNAGGGVANWVAEGGCGNLGNTMPVSGIIALRAITPIGAADASFTIQGKTGVIPAYSPPGTSVELDNAPVITLPVSAGQVSVSGGTAKDAVDVIVLPRSANDVLVCYDQGLNADVGDENRAIPRKFDPVDHYVRQRPTNTISLSELYVSNLKGLSQLRNRDVTLIGKFFPDGGAVPSEIEYLTGVRLNVPRNIPEEANDSVQVNATGTFRKRLNFTAEE